MKASLMQENIQQQQQQQQLQQQQQQQLQQQMLQQQMLKKEGMPGYFPIAGFHIFSPSPPPSSLFCPTSFRLS
jgi:hypothetical protein